MNYDFNPLQDSTNSAQVANTAAMEDDPEQAARAVELSDSTGVPATAIYGDVDGFEQQHKARLGADIIGNNLHIADYLNSHPMAARVSNDDLGQLDNASQAIGAIPHKSTLQRLHEALGVAKLGEVAFPGDPLGPYKELGLSRPTDLEYAAKHPGVASILTGLQDMVGFPIVFGSQILSGATNLVNHIAGRDAASLLEYGMMRGDLEAPGTGGLHDVEHIAGAMTSAAPWLRAGKSPPVGVHPMLDDAAVDQAKTDGKAVADALSESVKSATRDRAPDLYAGFVRNHVGDQEIGIAADAVRELYGEDIPHADDGKLGFVPDLADRLANAEATGGDVRVPLADWLAKVDPKVADQLHDHLRIRLDGITIEEGKVLAEQKKESVKQSISTEGEPTLPQGFTVDSTPWRTHMMEPGEGSARRMSIKDEQGREVLQATLFKHGDDAYQVQHIANDSKWRSKSGSMLYTKGLGEAAYLEAAKIAEREGKKLYVGASGETSQYAKAVHEKLAAKGFATTPNEYGRRQVSSSPVIIEPLPLVRGSAALEPMFSVGDRKLTLEREPRKADAYKPPDADFHDFHLLDDQGKKVGALTLSSTKDGKQLYVEMIQAGADKRMYEPNFLGPALVRDLFRQLKTEFPEAESITGHRVSGAREKADSFMKPSASPVIKFEDLANPTKWQGLHEGWKEIQQGVKGQPIEMTPEKQKVVDAVNSVLDRIAPKGVGVEGFEKIRTDAGDRAGGVYTRYEDAAPWISWSLEGRDPTATARHEAIHHLKSAGFFKPEEWDTLTRAARDGGWVEQYQIDKRFDADKLSNADKLEESIADAYKNWARHAEADSALGKIFSRIKELLDSIRTKLKEAFGGDLSAEEIFKKVESGEVGGREPTGRAEGGSKFEEGEAVPFEKAAALGMTKDQYTRYQKLIDRRNTEDLAAAHKAALEYQRKTQTKEWKANRTAMRDQVREELESRPDLALDQLMSQLKFHPDALSEQQRSALPKEYLQKKDGIAPDDAAGYFGYHSGDAMVERLGLITRDRQAAGMSAREWLNHLIDTETDRRMEQEHGNLDQNILEDAKEQAISATQLDILHEEVLHLGLKAGSEFPISKEQLKAWNKELFDKTPIGSISTDEYLRVAGKAGKAAEMSLLKEDFADAFREKQRQNNAMIMASYAKAYEKSRKAFNRTAKTLAKRESPSIAQEWMNWIHDILQRTGNPIRRSVQDLAENIARQPEKTLSAFAEAKEAETFGLRETPIADFLLNPDFRASMDSLTAEQFAGLKQSIDVLAKQGRDEKKIIVQGEAADRGEVLREMRAKLGTFPERTPEGERSAVNKAMDTPRTYMAGSTAIETIMNRWDRADPRGIFNRYISYPLARAANYKSRLQREYAKAYGDLGPIKDGDKFVDAPFADPDTRSEANPEGRAWPGFTRKNVLAMLQNAGNKSNWRVLARGYSADPDALMTWLHRNTTKEDWDRAQKMGDTVFHSLVDKADTVYENLTGATIEKIPLEPIETPYGTYPGWYHPLMADPIRKEVWVKQENGTWQRNATGKRGSVMDDSDYFHASTANGYTKRRTGAVYPLDLNFDMVPSRIKQMIHDIAFRDTIIQTEKIFGNAAFQTEVRKHYGQIYGDLLMPYLRSMAGNESIPSKAGAKAAQISETLRQNVISTYIGFNPYTALKHGPTAAVMSMNEVGPVNFFNAVKSLYGQSPELGLSNSEFALKHSEELQRRERHWQDTIAGQHNEIEGNTNLRSKVIEKGSWLVAQSDMLSAKPTWVAGYNKYLSDGLSHGESVDLADRAVRRAHGSTAETNQPALVRGGGALHGWLTSVYGFFGTAMQRRIEIGHQLNDTYQLGKEGELRAAAANIPKLTRDIMTYVIWPTAVEEWVTGLSTDDRRGWGTHLISASLLGLSSSALYLRDLMHAFATGQDPGVGLASSPLHDVANAVRDVRKGKAAFNREHAGKTVGDLLTVFGEGTGMAPKALASATRFGIDLVNKQAKPKTMTDYARGLTRGTMKLRQEK